MCAGSTVGRQLLFVVDRRIVGTVFPRVYPAYIAFFGPAKALFSRFSNAASLINLQNDYKKADIRAPLCLRAFVPRINPLKQFNPLKQQTICMEHGR